MYKGDWYVLKKGGSRRMRSHFITWVGINLAEAVCGMVFDKEAIEPDTGEFSCKRCVEKLEKGKG